MPLTYCNDKVHSVYSSVSFTFWLSARQRINMVDQEDPSGCSSAQLYGPTSTEWSGALAQTTLDHHGLPSLVSPSILSLPPYFGHLLLKLPGSSERRSLLQESDRAVLSSQPHFAPVLDPVVIFHTVHRGFGPQGTLQQSRSGILFPTPLVAPANRFHPQPYSNQGALKGSLRLPRQRGSPWN